MSIAEKIIAFNQSLKIEADIPSGINVLFPFSDEKVIEATKAFYFKYYNDNNRRTIILGINPGRHGAGITGIPFTDPIRLLKECGIGNSFKKNPELSSDFVYRLINTISNVKDFYSKFLISSLCPLGFTKDGKNLNYYDNKTLENSVTPFIVETLRKQIDFEINTERCFCLGEGKNFKYFSRINRQYNFFKEIIPLSHPRYIMQYKRKMLNQYIDRYKNALS
ncbi:MAG: DUF4918 family protein [Chlorobi bacterium]|nr:DUF4918 family protein [Chlorobiota bacterium]